MRLVYYDLNFTADIDRGCLYSIVLEQAYVFERFLVKLHGQLNKENTAFSLSEKENDLDLVKCCDLVTTTFDLTFGKKEITRKLFAELETVAQAQGLTEELSEIYSNLFELLDRLRFAADYDIEYTSDYSILDVMKHSGVHIAEPKGSYAEKLIEYIVVMNRLLKKVFFVIANCSSYLGLDDYRHIEKTAEYYDLCIVFVENKQLGLPNMKKEYIIDMDLCEIR